MNSEIISEPERDEKIRFLLGRPGKRNLLCIGLNPSTADKDSLDPTSRTIEKIAHLHGFDGWLLVNVCPERATRPEQLATNPDQKLMTKNREFIASLLAADRYGIETIWVAWGNAIDDPDRAYLKESICELFELFKTHDLTYLCVGTNLSGHPTHPSPQAMNQKFGSYERVRLMAFDFKTYVEEIKC